MFNNKLSSGFLMRIWICVGCIALAIFLYGFIHEVDIGHPVLYTLLTIGLIFKLLRILFEWYHYAGVCEITKFPSHTKWQVDMLTTACPEEPREMVENTLRAMVNVRYPHQTYLCDEGNDPYYQMLCQKLGVHYITRSTRENAKAGNINNALKQATGDICVILDPDHVPKPDFLDQVLPYFEDPEIGFVQVVQAYKNQADSLIARAAAEQTYIFYGPYMRAMSQYGTAQAIGANCTFRREALNSIGGHAPGLTEDMHTSMLLHAKGWKSVYVPNIVSRGLVPNSLSAYYEQQLKWARGTFDLWIKVYPRLFHQFSWRQKLHYGLLPLYYMLGIITLIDIAVPIYSLFSGSYPWHMNPVIFFAYYTPLLVLLIAIRLFAQRWLHEPRENGLHLLGGILRVGSWWIFIMGFAYTLLNIKVPYIPTPKAYDAKNEFLLGIPNLLIVFLSVGAIIYGLHLDWQPYSFLMAGFAFFNAWVLLLAFIIGQHTWLVNLNKFRSRLGNKLSVPAFRLSYTKANLVAARSLFFFPLAVVLIALPLSFMDSNLVLVSERPDRLIEKEIGGFYTGIYMPEVDQSSTLQDILPIEKKSQHSFSIISTYLTWGPGPLPVQRWQSIIDHGAVPMITWEPWTNLFLQYADHPDLSHNRKVFYNITQGCFDEYLDEVAVAIRSLSFPVFLRFAHEMDNPMYPWSATGGNTPEEFKAAWHYIHDRFDSLGVQNVSWVWSPWSPEAMDQYFPYGREKAVSHYVDWISFTCLNYGLASSNRQWHMFKEIYEPFREKIKELSLNLPVMLAEFGSTTYGGDGASWVSRALLDIRQDYPEIKSVVLFYSDQDKNWITDWRPHDKAQFINWTYDISSLISSLSLFDTPTLSTFQKKISLPKRHNHRDKLIAGTYGNFTLQIGEKPFYIKGICYNTAHDWHDGFLPLTRKQLVHDFQQIKAMGANTIRRYEPSIYDKNIFNVAEEEGLKVLYGFWFDPAIDYYNDTAAVVAYEEKVLDYVRKYKDRKCIIGWNIGNETWGLLKKHYAKPYLNLTRRAYLDFLERLAQKIHKVDSVRPVFSSEEHDHFRLQGAVFEFKNYVPSIDVIGINSYFRQNIKDLQAVFAQYDTLRPYVVTEFGPKGYWSHEFGDFRNDTLLIEVSSLSKAHWYERQWREYIQNNKGHNLGGFAFSWRDRFEGTATWFGITDYKGRPKPTYYYLQKAWLGKSVTDNQFPDLSIVGHWYPVKPGETIWLSAGVTNDFKGSLSYEWEVYEEESWNRFSLIKSTLLGNQYIELKMPAQKSRYRVYVHATDSVGNVVTASRPLLFE